MAVEDLYPESTTTVNLQLDLSAMPVNIAQNFLTLDNAAPNNVIVLTSDHTFPPIQTHTLGTVIIAKTGSAAHISFPVPVPGLPVNDGDDGTTLRVLASTQFAHVCSFPTGSVVTPAGAKSTITMVPSGLPAQSFLLVAYNGQWYCYSITNGTAT